MEVVEDAFADSQVGTHSDVGGAPMSQESPGQLHLITMPTLSREISTLMRPLTYPLAGKLEDPDSVSAFG